MVYTVTLCCFVLYCRFCPCYTSQQHMLKCGTNAGIIGTLFNCILDCTKWNSPRPTRDIYQEILAEMHKCPVMEVVLHCFVGLLYAVYVTSLNLGTMQHKNKPLGPTMSMLKIMPRITPICLHVIYIPGSSILFEQ